MANYFINERLISLASQPDTLFVHPHSPRTGGKTLRHKILVHVFGRKNVYTRKYVRDMRPWAELTDSDLANYRAYTELSNFRVTGLKRPAVVITVVRHPVYRALSLYQFIKDTEGHRYQELAKKLPIEEFYPIASDDYPPYFRNIQVRRLCKELDARVALNVIREHAVGVALTSQLPEFAEEFSRRMGWPKIELERMPTDEERYDKTVSQKLRDMVLKENVEDLALYEAIANGLSPEVASVVPRASAATTPNLLQRVFRRLTGRSRPRARIPKPVVERSAAVPAPVPGVPICNICGTAPAGEPGAPVNRTCAKCGSNDRGRTFKLLFESALMPLIDKHGWRDALLLSPALIERTTLTPKFANVTTSSLFNTYKGNFVKADIRDLAPFKDQSFDYVQACNVLDYVAELESALKAIHRVLRRGGTFCFHIIDGRILTGQAPLTVKYMAGVKVSYYPEGYEVPDIKIGRETLKALLADCGFDCEAREIADPLAGRVCTWWLCRRTD